MNAAIKCLEAALAFGVRWLASRDEKLLTVSVLVQAQRDFLRAVAVVEVWMRGSRST